MVSARQRQRPRQVLPLLAVSVVVMTGALGCSGDDDGDEDARSDGEAEETTTTSSTGPPTTLTPEQEAEATYMEMTEVVYELLTTTRDPDDPDLARLATDPVLSDIRDNLITMRAEHHIAERGDRTAQEIRTVTVDSAGSATIRACSIGNDRVVDQDDGSVVEEGVSASLVDVTLVHQDDGWRVSDITVVEAHQGAVECPA